MTPVEPRKIISGITGERVAFLLGGTLIGALVIGFGFKMATPVVKKMCQSILEAPAREGRAARIVAVEAVTLKAGPISRRITTVGKLRANESVTIRAEMQGRIKEIAFKEGTLVKKGDVLIRFDDEELQAELERAEADLEYREVKLKRLETLQAKNLGKGTEYDEVRGGRNIARAQVAQAKAKLEKATIYAPFEGRIGLMEVSAGAIVDTSKELVTIVDFDPMKIEFKVPEKFVHDIGEGQSAEIRLDSISDEVFRATVEALDSRVDPQTHSIAARATIPNEDGKLRTGLFGAVSVIVGVKNDALLVPESALSREGDIEYVWVVTNGKAGRKRVLTGTKENGQVQVVAGLHPDEIIVTSGQLKLGEGTAVRITNMASDDIEVEDDGETEEKPASPAPGVSPSSSSNNGQDKPQDNRAASPEPAQTENGTVPSPGKAGTQGNEEPPGQDRETQSNEKNQDLAAATLSAADTQKDPRQHHEGKTESSFFGNLRDSIAGKFTGK